MVTRSLLLLLAACSVDVEPSSLPVDAAAPPPNLRLELPATTSPGAPLDVRVRGAQPGQTVQLILGDGRQGTDIGACLPRVGGRCLDFRAGTNGYTTITLGTADAQGIVTRRLTVPANKAPGDLLGQAIALSPTPGESNVRPFAVVAACPTDAHEPDDVPADAATITGPADLVACLATPDLTEWFVPAGATIEVTASYDPTDDDLDLELLDDTLNALDGSYRNTGDEAVLWNNNTGSDQLVYARAFAVRDAGWLGVPYTIDGEVVTPAACVDGPEEPDDDANNATLVANSTTVSGQSCPADADWYAFDLDAGEQVTVSADAVPGEGTVQVRLVNSAGQTLDGPDDDATFATANAQRVYAEVTLAGDDALGGGAAYNLGVDLQAVRLCAEDFLEPNDSRGSARAVAGSWYNDLESCTGDEDWYRVTAVAGQVVSVDLTFAHADGDVDVALYDPAGNQVASSAGTGDSESIQFTTTSSGTWSARVYLYQDRGDPVVDGAVYDLRMTVL